MDNNKPTVKLKTISLDINKKYYNALNYMSKISKNIYNTSLYCHNIYTLFQKNIYDDFYNQLKLDISKIKDKQLYIDENYNNILLSIFNKYHKIYSENKEINDKNNKIIYQHIKTDLQNKILNTTNIETYEKKYIDKFKKICSFNDTNKFYVFDNNIKKIIKSFYDKQYNTMKNELINKKPLTYIDSVLENEVKTDTYYYKKSKKSKSIIIDNIKITLKSNQAILKYIIFHGHLQENKNKLPSDVIGTIIDKFYTNIKSYYGLLQKHIFARKPRFIKKEYNNLYYTYRSFKHKKNNLRLTVGDYVAENYSQLVNNNLISIDKRKYYPKSCIIENRKKGKFKEYIKIKNNKYVHKSNIIDGYYFNIKLPKILNDKKINYLQIKKIHNKYKILITYNQNIDIPIINIPDNKLIEKSVSIDTGIINLMTIYNPSGKQHIIKGNKLSSINTFYNGKINKLKSINKKKYNKDTFNRLYSLLEERKNKLYTEINKIINKIVEVYNDKHIFIIGYNERWKNKVNLGTDTNKKFYQIPYRYILDKLQNKLENLGKQLIITEESYTSKCDALTLEEIKKKDKYNGKRSLRGLYISGNGKAINADLNGAINIMRKKYELTKITGHNIYCPEIIQIP